VAGYLHFGQDEFEFMNESSKREELTRPRACDDDGRNKHALGEATVTARWRRRT
jgi:hypothetical protein